MIIGYLYTSYINISIVLVDAIGVLCFISNSYRHFPYSNTYII